MKKVGFIIIEVVLILLFIIGNIAIAKEVQESVEVTETAIQEETAINVTYKYKEETNTVIATIISNKELKNNKSPMWKLSEDKKHYSFEYDGNTDYITTVTDKDGNVIPVQIKVTDIDESPAIVEVSYEYREETNTVIATMTSNRELQNTKTTWKLSEDKKHYTFEFTTNTNYISSVVDRFGHIIPIEINITDIDYSPAIVEVSYEYKEETNTVMATMTSNRELQNTKATWKLSEDKKHYTFEFTTNTNYMSSVVDKFGNIIPIEIKIDKIDESPAKVEVSYEYKPDTDTVIATMTSNRELQNTKTTWKLSEDKRHYTFEFTTNTNYMSSVVDKFGNVIPIQIEITQIHETKVEVSYRYKEETNTVIVTMTSNNELKNTKTTWKLSEDKKQYTFEFTTNTNYMSSVVDIYGRTIPVQINVTQIKIAIEMGTYGTSGAKIHGIAGGSDLEYFKFGDGKNVLFTTFCVHGYEDSWDRDGTVLVDIANNFYNRLVNEYDTELAKDWTIYIFKEVNPDGRKLGTTRNGPGRTTLYSKLDKGMDINRCWQTGSEYKRYTDNRNYNGTEGFQAYEAETLRDFLLSHKSQNGKTVLVDLHGWEDQLIGDEEICKYYKQQYTSCATRNYGKYGTQYLITWARQNLGAKVALVELPKANNYEEVNNMGLSDKYINATLEMLRNER